MSCPIMLDDWPQDGRSTGITGRVIMKVFLRQTTVWRFVGFSGRIIVVQSLAVCACGHHHCS